MLFLSRSTIQGAANITNAEYVCSSIQTEIYVDAPLATLRTISQVSDVQKGFPECGFPLQAWAKNIFG